MYMNTIIKDLGIIEKRHWYEVKCFDCPDIIKVRSDRLNKICRCKSCQANERTKQAKLLASKTKNLTDTKTCTKCGLEKHVFDFHKKTSTYSQHRSVCKACRFFEERDNNTAYYKTEHGKLVSTNNQGTRRQQIYDTKDGSITIESLKALKEKQNHTCYYCKCALDYTTPKQVHLDHVIPLSKGGLHTLSNVVWSCASCNSSKSNK